MPNESVGKVLLTSETEVFGGHLTIPKYEVVDCGTFYEVTFFCISPKNLLGNFFYKFNVKLRGAAVFCRVPLERLVLPQSVLPVTWPSMKMSHCNNAKSLRVNLVDQSV